MVSTAMWGKDTWPDQNLALKGKALSVLARVLGGSYSASILALDGEHAYSALGCWPILHISMTWLGKSLWAVAGLRGFVPSQPHWRHFVPVSDWCASRHSWWVWVGLYWAIWKGLGVTWLPVLSRLLSFGTQSDVTTCPIERLWGSHRPLLDATGLVSQEKHLCWTTGGVKWASDEGGASPDPVCVCVCVCVCMRTRSVVSNSLQSHRL